MFLKREICTLYFDLCRLSNDESDMGTSKQGYKEQSTKLYALEFQYARIIDVQRFAITEDCDDDSQAHRSLGSSDGHNYKNKELTGDILKETSKRDEGQIHSVEHQLNTHEHGDHISFDNDADDTNGEQ